MENMTKILVVVKGGVVESVYCNDISAETTLIDYDNIEYGPELNVIEEANFNTEALTVSALKENIEEANKIIRKNIDNFVEQRR